IIYLREGDLVFDATGFYPTGVVKDDLPRPQPLLQGLAAGVTANAVAAFGEELGWRGFLQKEFSGFGFRKASFLIGVIWGIWHASLILLGHNYPHTPIAGVFMMVVWCVLFGPDPRTQL
ncbi:MAG: CPBP family intramembrane glutamic endopeptidase, partial [Candidatus Aminicenantaceae bacterium]